MFVFFAGCPVEDLSIPIDIKEFDWSDYLAIAKEQFIGRHWLYQELEFLHEVHTNDVTGVLIVGDPGTGKSALSAQLICSRTSSPTIYNHVLGYHLCKHSDKNTQIAGKFVRNLADMTARRLPEFGYIVSNSSYIQRSLSTDCVTIEDPVGCFEQAILTPLKNLTNVPKENWYVVIDALDECLTQSETSHSIVYLLRQKLSRFPSWLKLVLTSRNVSSVSLDSNGVKKLVIDPEDPRNLEDIKLFLSTRFYRDGSLIRQLKAWFGDDSIENTERLISVLLRKSQGNFLFVKEMLRQWETSRQAQSDPYRLPKSLGELYHSYLERLYNGKEKFKPVRRILELLVSTFEPLTQNEMFQIISVTEESLDEDYDFKDRMSELGHFLRYGKNGTVTLYHLSLSEWLTSESNRGGPFYVSKKKGHEMFCDYHFNLIRKGNNSTLLSYIHALVQHIAFAGWKEKYVEEFLSFPSQVVNSSDPNSNRTLLHLVATVNNSEVLKLVLRHFLWIDTVDDRGITPAFLAAEHGLVDNLALLVQRGAKVNHKTKSLTSLYRGELEKESNKYYNTESLNFFLVHKSKHRFWGSTILHVAAYKGHREVVYFLLNNSAFISSLNDVHLTALQIAAENGHLGVVKALHEAGALADQTALHHAAANNRLEVVKYLLQVGVKDECMRCDGSFYWLNSQRRFHSKLLVMRDATVTKRCNCSKNADVCVGVKPVLQVPVSRDAGLGELFDDRHLIFCETALHAAVSIGHKEIVKELLSKDTCALSCYDYTGRTPLHEAVRTHNDEIVKMLLNNPQKKVNSPCSYWQDVQEQHTKTKSRQLDDIEYKMYHQDICHCGYTPLHLAARYGHTNIGMRLIDSGAQIHAKDCSGAAPLHVAACHNHRDFVRLLLSNYGAVVNSRTLNGSTPLHTAAVCGAVEVIDVLLYHGANPNYTDENGLTALHYTVLNILSSQLDEIVPLNRTSYGDPDVLVNVNVRGRYLAEFFRDNGYVKNTKNYQWLNSLIHLILRGSDVNAADIKGRTTLHITAENGLADAVNVLLQRNARPNILDKKGKTPLEVAVESATLRFEYLPSVSLQNSFDVLGQHLMDHELVVYLLLSSGASFKTCQPSSASGSGLLHRAIINNQPYIAQLLLLKGASLTCKDSQGRTPLVAYLHNGGKWVDLILKHFNASVAIECGQPFNLSVFHLLCYRPPSQEDSNFFINSVCDDRKCSSQKSPITSSIERYLLKRDQRIDSCLDAEGFTSLQRAAQGANIVAVRNLIKHGADVSLLSPQGHDALTLAILHAGGNVWGNRKGNEGPPTKDNVSDVAIELLRHKMKTSKFQIVCDSGKAELTLYHLAASRGLMKFIKQIFEDKNLHKLSVDCPNRDGITPMYLAKTFSNLVENDLKNPWEEIVRFIKKQGGMMQYPNRGAEYNAIYTRLYGWIPNEFKLNLRPDIRGFIFKLLSTYKFWPTNSIHCSINETALAMGIGSPLSTENLFRELIRQLELLNSQRRRSMIIMASCALEDIKLCQENRRRGSFFFKRYARYTRFLSPKAREVNLGRVQESLFYLMRMWHENVFGDFACLKMFFCMYRPYFVDERKSRLLIEEYEGSTPLWYLNVICIKFSQAFAFDVLHYLTDVTYLEFTTLYYEYPIFITERMGWTVDQIRQTEPWPLEFLVKFSLGFYRQYDYLKVLNVGLEPKTHISLYSDKMKQIFLTARARKARNIYKHNS